MFENAPHGGVFESWVERWRRFRGIDRWPVVQGTVTRKEFVEGQDGGGRYEFTLSYPLNEGDTAGTMTFSDSYQEYSLLNPGDQIPLRVHPSIPGRTVLADPSSSGRNLTLLFLFVTVMVFLLVIKCCT